jgi:small subunit ribosomal protein S20
VANHPSALKRHRQSEKRRARNRYVKATVRSAIRTVREAVAAKDPAKAREALGAAARDLDRSVTQGVHHHGTASRKISRLTKLVNKIAAK